MRKLSRKLMSTDDVKICFFIYSFPESIISNNKKNMRELEISDLNLIKRLSINNTSSLLEDSFLLPLITPAIITSSISLSSLSSSLIDLALLIGYIQSKRDVNRSRVIWICHFFRPLLCSIEHAKMMNIYIYIYINVYM